MSLERIKQECNCGNDEYHLNLLLGSNKPDKVASCTECGRITMSVGDGIEYYTLDIREVVQ